MSRRGGAGAWPRAMGVPGRSHKCEKPATNRGRSNRSCHLGLGFRLGMLAALRGFEPRLPESESGVLPLDERATGRKRFTTNGFCLLAWPK